MDAFGPVAVADEKVGFWGGGGGPRRTSTSFHSRFGRLGSDAFDRSRASFENGSVFMLRVALLKLLGFLFFFFFLIRRTVVRY